MLQFAFVFALSVTLQSNLKTQTGYFFFIVNTASPLSLVTVSYETRAPLLFPHPDRRYTHSCATFPPVLREICIALEMFYLFFFSICYFQKGDFGMFLCPHDVAFGRKLSNQLLGLLRGRCLSTGIICFPRLAFTPVPIRLSSCCFVGNANNVLGVLSVSETDA